MNFPPKDNKLNYPVASVLMASFRTMLSMEHKVQTPTNFTISLYLNFYN